MHYSAMTDQTAGMILLSQVGLVLSCLPLIFYIYNCGYYLRQIWLKIRREGGFSNVSLREYTFLAYAISTCLGIAITIIVVFGFNGTYYYNSSLTDLELYDVSIMCYALLATIGDTHPLSTHPVIFALTEHFLTNNAVYPPSSTLLIHSMN